MSYQPGGPAFRSDDSLELIHSHIPKRPMPPSEAVASIPELLSRHRHEAVGQDGRGTLPKCPRTAGRPRTLRTAVDRSREIPLFALGQQDMSDCFVVPQHLYGREHQLDALLGAFEQTRLRSIGLHAVAGYAGIGKTTLIQELYKPLVR